MVQVPKYNDLQPQENLRLFSYHRVNNELLRWQRLLGLIQRPTSLIKRVKRMYEPVSVTASYYCLEMHIMM